MSATNQKRVGSIERSIRTIPDPDNTIPLTQFKKRTSFIRFYPRFRAFFMHVRGSNLPPFAVPHIPRN